LHVGEVLQGDKGIDEVLPVLKCTIRDFVKRVEIPIDALDYDISLQ